MLFLPEHGRTCHLGVQYRENWRRVSTAESRQGADSGNASVVDVAQVNCRVDLQLSSKIVRLDRLVRIRLKAPPEFAQILLGHGDACRMPVTDTLYEQRWHAF